MSLRISPLFIQVHTDVIIPSVKFLLFSYHCSKFHLVRIDESVNTSYIVILLYKQLTFMSGLQL